MNDFDEVLEKRQYIHLIELVKKYVSPYKYNHELLEQRLIELVNCYKIIYIDVQNNYGFLVFKDGYYQRYNGLGWDIAIYLSEWYPDRFKTFKSNSFAKQIEVALKKDCKTLVWSAFEYIQEDVR